MLRKENRVYVVAAYNPNIWKIGGKIESQKQDIENSYKPAASCFREYDRKYGLGESM